MSDQLSGAEARALLRKATESLDLLSECLVRLSASKVSWLKRQDLVVEAERRVRAIRRMVDEAHDQVPRSGRTQDFRQGSRALSVPRDLEETAPPLSRRKRYPSG